MLFTSDNLLSFVLPLETKNRSCHGGRGEFIRPNNWLRANEFAPTRAAQRFQGERYSQPTAVFRLMRETAPGCKPHRRRTSVTRSWLGISFYLKALGCS